MNIFALFSNSSGPITGLTPSLTILTASGDTIQNNVTMTEVGGGIYKYTFNDNDNFDYVFSADGGASITSGNRYCFGSNELPQNKGGGGLALTHDMMIMLKRISDNFVTSGNLKLEFKEFIQRIKELMEEKNEDLKTYQETNNESKFSELNSSIKSQLNELIKKSNDNTLFVNMKQGFNNVLEEFYKNKDELLNLINLNNQLSKSMELINKAVTESSGEIISKYHAYIEQITTKLDSGNNSIIGKLETSFNLLKEDISTSSGKIVNEFTVLSKFRQKEQLGFINSLSENISKFFSDSEVINVKKLQKISELDEQIKTLNNKLNKFESATMDKINQISFDKEKENIITELKIEKEKVINELDLIKTNFTSELGKVNIMIDKLKEEIDSSKFESNNSLLDIKNKSDFLSSKLDKINELAKKSDIDYINIELKKTFNELNDKINLLNTDIINKTSILIKKSKRDDLDEVMSQINLVTNDE